MGPHDVGTLTARLQRAESDLQTVQQQLEQAQRECARLVAISHGLQGQILLLRELTATNGAAPVVHD